MERPREIWPQWTITHPVLVKGTYWLKSVGWDGICDRSQEGGPYDPKSTGFMHEIHELTMFECIYIYINVFSTCRMSHNFLLNFRLVLLAATMQQAQTCLGHSPGWSPMPQFLRGTAASVWICFPEFSLFLKMVTMVIITSQWCRIFAVINGWSHADQALPNFKTVATLEKMNVRVSTSKVVTAQNVSLKILQPTTLTANQWKIHENLAWNDGGVNEQWKQKRMLDSLCWLVHGIPRNWQISCTISYKKLGT